jgi:hypothetical protein
MTSGKFPKGWSAARVRRVLVHYETQSEDEAVAEDEAALDAGPTVMKVPRELVPTVRQLIARSRSVKTTRPRPHRRKRGT